MAERAIIRIGDPTSHGGTVLEGFSTLNVYGKNAAGIGHKGHCPKCKTTFTIIAGASNYAFMGKNVAVEGMLTSCGAVLIATQGQATVDNTPGGSSSVVAAGMATAAVAASTSVANDDYEYFYTVERDDGSPIKLAYRVDNGDEKLHEGEICGEGNTAAFPMDNSGEPTFWIPMI
ncbi:PAAR domain-containing protein [Deefgea salmonis]|uniref:PAAR domain-containing protein n=1 Tax=Deefgea salmonis TaxID=2875502 RepID=A0ABS8BH00_9NEIS|nr:PAAR domain-containing protein [Deefgea salmonis]MCB5194994.1 PAAR domain-containing protein [Deefgea salmonis]